MVMFTCRSVFIKKFLPPVKRQRIVKGIGINMRDSHDRENCNRCLAGNFCDLRQTFNTLSVDASDSDEEEVESVSYNYHTEMAQSRQPNPRYNATFADAFDTIFRSESDQTTRQHRQSSSGLADAVGTAGLVVGIGALALGALAFLGDNNQKNNNR